MSESFVDLTYRGLPLGRRVKLSQVRPASGYLELPAPMPVGTKVAIATDDGVALDAIVTAIHEQVAGEGRVPGMIVAPVLAGDAATWWQARVTLPAEEKAAPPAPPAPARAKSVTLRPRSQTLQTPPPVAVEDAPTTISPELSVPEPLEDDGKKTMVMEALDPTLLDEPELRRRDSHEVIDDGKLTTVMESVDLSALGLDGAVVTNGAPPEDSKPTSTGSGAVKKRRKRR